MDEEIALPGGNITTVVRVGDTVRRAAGPWTDTVHDLLRHLRARGFTEAPEPLGRDAEGREVLSFLPGETVGDDVPWPAWAWDEDVLAQTGRLLRRYHDVVRDYSEPADAVWRGHTGGPRRAGEVICHNDLAPYNLVYRDGRITGVIDWDLAAPNVPEWDLAYTALSAVPMQQSADAAVHRAPSGEAPRRLRLLCDAYGLEHRDGFVATIRRRTVSMADAIEQLAAPGQAVYRRLVEDGHVARIRRDVAFLDEHHDALQQALTA